MSSGEQDGDGAVMPHDRAIGPTPRPRLPTGHAWPAGEGDVLCRGVADLLADAGVDGAVLVADRGGSWFDVRVTFADGGDAEVGRGVVAELDAIFRGPVGERWYDCRDCGAGRGTWPPGTRSARSTCRRGNVTPGGEVATQRETPADWWRSPACSADAGPKAK
jgi:hypothetical protein